MSIKVIRSCGASGVMLEAGRIYAVPDEVSARDAAILVRMGKAQTVHVNNVVAPVVPVDKPRRKKIEP